MVKINFHSVNVREITFIGAAIGPNTTFTTRIKDKIKFYFTSVARLNKTISAQRSSLPSDGWMI